MNQPHRRTLAAATLVLLGAPGFAQGDRLDASLAPGAEELAVFDARAAEHLLGRAGFGATQAEVRAAVELGLDATLDRLFAGDPLPREPWTERLVGVRAVEAELSDLPRDERQRRRRALRQQDRAQLAEWRAWWVGRLLAGDDPLRERMTLFWHGHMPSAMSDVGNGHELIVQNRLLREHALGDVHELMRRVARDPAMLEFLDNDENRRGRPNENFARELLELFLLGEGNYTEADVADVARAFTGWTDVDGGFRIRRAQHDAGPKVVLGVRGDLGGDDVLALLLADERCARHIAGELLAYFEGRPAEPERVARYAELLRVVDFRVAPFLRALFRDATFYRDEVVGTRVAGPLDFLVGAAHRLGVDPPPDWVAAAASLLGQALFEPPTVEGWPGGTAWISTATLMQRGNLAGVLTGALEPSALTASDAGGRPGALGPELRVLAGTDWRARPNLSRLVEPYDARLDGELVRALVAELLAVPLSDETLTEAVRALRAERRALGLEDGHLLDRPRAAEEALRRVAHLLLSLPEAQLH